MFDLKAVWGLANERASYELTVFIEEQVGDCTNFILSGILPRLTEDEIQHTVITGNRVMLDSMLDDLNSVPSGTTGPVIDFDDCGHIRTDWDNGQGLNFIPSVNKWHIAR